MLLKQSRVWGLWFRVYDVRPRVQVSSLGETGQVEL